MPRWSILLCCLLATACAQPLPALNFSVAHVMPARNRLDADLRSITVTPGQPGETIGRVSIDTGAMNAWKEALNEALTRMAIFHDDSRNRVSLQVKILRTEVPPIGLSFTATVDARYEFVDRASGAVIYTQTVSSSGTAPYEFGTPAIARAREAANRAVQDNIAQFLRGLEATAAGGAVR